MLNVVMLSDVMLSVVAPFLLVASLLSRNLWPNILNKNLGV
jgi:hypothetical protein